MTPRKALFPGTFDPCTNGHLWLVKKGLEIFDEIEIGIGINPDKKPIFTPEERVEMWHRVLNSHCIVGTRGRVQALIYENWFTVSYAKVRGCQFILRGMRTVQDYHDEYGMQLINYDMEPDVCPVYLMAPPDLADVASSRVKSMMGYKGWGKAVRRYVPDEVYEFLKQKCGVET